MRRAGFLAIFGALLFLGAVSAAALEVFTPTWLAPTSIPVDLSGDAPAPTGIIRFEVAVNGNGAPSEEIHSLDITLNGDLVPADIAEIYLTWESQFNPNRDGIYDNDADEIELRTMTDEGGSGSFSGTGPYSLTMNLPANEITFFQAGNDYAYMFIAVDFVNGVDTSKAIDIRVEDIVYDEYVAPDGTDTLTGPFPPAGTDIELDDYEVTVAGDASFLGTTTLAAPGATVTALQLDFAVSDATLLADGYVDVDSLRFRRVGTAQDSDTKFNGITVYADDDATPGFSVGDTRYGTGTMTGGYAVVNLTLADLLLSTGNLTYYVAVDVADASVPTRTFGLEIETPATDTVFGDGIIDISGNQSFEYDQIGLVDPATPSTPGTTYTFEIEEADDTFPPSVIDTTPDDLATGVSRSVVIQVTFSEDMATIDASDVTISGTASGTVDTTTDGVFTFNTTTNQSFTFARDTLFEYLETVTVTVSGSVTDNSSNFNPMGTPYVFTFDIQSPTPPSVLGTVPANGGTDAAIGTTVGIIFSEDMDESTVTDEANFSLVAAGSSTEIPGVMTYSPGGFTATFTPDDVLQYSTEYTGTVTTGAIDAEGTSLAEDYTFTFTTIAPAVGLSFTDIIVANNQITPGSIDPMQIFIETPAGANPTDTVTIQVFTANGRRVATLTTAGETYQDVIARQPILWDGTNGRSQPLGPGLYFVQVSSAGYRRALRVRIVR